MNVDFWLGFGSGVTGLAAIVAAAVLLWVIRGEQP